MSERTKHYSVLVLTLVLLIAFSYGCDNDTSSNAQPVLGSGDLMLSTEASGFVDSSGEECTGLSGLAVGDRATLSIMLPSDEQLMGMGPASLLLSNDTTNDELSCMGDVNQDNNPLPTNIICNSVETTSGIGFLDIGNEIEIAISFSSDINQMKVTNLTTMDCVNITMHNLVTCFFVDILDGSCQ